MSSPINLPNQKPAPEPAKTAFVFFIDALRQGGQPIPIKLSDIDGRLMSSYIDAYKRLSEQQQRVFAEMEANDRRRFETQIQAYSGREYTASDEKSRPKKRKQKKDPNQPKRPLTAFFCFTIEERKKVKESNPTLKVTEISKLLGSMWREMVPQLKAKYIAQADADKERYDKEMTAYSQTDAGKLQKRKRNRTSTVDGNGPVAEQETSMESMDNRSNVQDSIPSTSSSVARPSVLMNSQNVARKSNPFAQATAAQHGMPMYGFEYPQHMAPWNSSTMAQQQQHSYLNNPNMRQPQQLNSSIYLYPNAAIPQPNNGT